MLNEKIQMKGNCIMTNEMENVNGIANDILKGIDESWPSPIVLRKDVTKFSHGLVTTKTIATMDSIGRGAPSIKINGKVAYNKQDIIQWLASRIEKQEQPKEIRGAPRRGKNDILLQK
jgi:hypothetical protein